MDSRGRISEGIKDGASARQQESEVAVNFRNYYQRCWIADDSRSGAIYDIFPETLDSETIVVTAIEDGITNVIGRVESYGDAFSLCERHDASASSAKADRTR